MQSTRYERRRLQMLASRAAGEVLDLGHAAMPNPFLDGQRTTGLDLAVPATPSGYRVDLVGSVLDVAEIVGPSRYDTVIAGELIEHLDEPYRLLQGIREVLASSGRLLLSTPNPVGFPTVLLEWKGSRRWFYTEDHTYYFPPRWVWRMLDRSGYEVIETLAVGLWLPIGYVPWCPVGLSYQVIYVAAPRRMR